MTVLFCRQCGNPREQVQWGASRLAKFCGNCGHPYEDQNVAQQEVPDQWRDQVYEESSEEEPNSSDEDSVEKSEKPLRTSPPRRPVPLPPTNAATSPNHGATNSRRSPPSKTMSNQEPLVSPTNRAAKDVENGHPTSSYLSRTQLNSNSASSTFPRAGVKQSPASTGSSNGASKKFHKKSPSSHVSGFGGPTHMRNFSKPPPSPKALNFKSPKRGPQKTTGPYARMGAPAGQPTSAVTGVPATTSPKNIPSISPKDPPLSPTTTRAKTPGHGRWSSRGKFPAAKSTKNQGNTNENQAPSWVSKAQEKQKRRDELQLFSPEREIKERNAALASKGKAVPSHPETLLTLANIPYADGSISDLGIDGASFCASPSTPVYPNPKKGGLMMNQRSPAASPMNEPKIPVNGQRRGSFVTRATADDGAIPGSEMQLAELQKKFYSDIHLVANRRSLIREGVLRKLTRHGPRSYHFHLFTDIIIYSDSTPVGFKIHRVINLNTVQVEDTDFASVRQDCQFSYAFKFLSREKSFVILAQSKEEKQKWLGDIQKCLAPFEARSRGGSVSTMAPLWEPDEMSNACKICSREFNLMIRKHHCRRCGSLVCNSCSPNRVVVPHIDHKPVRVCTRCQSDVNQVNAQAHVKRRALS